MSSPIAILWPPTNTNGIALQQNVLAGQMLVLKSPLPDYPNAAFMYDKMIRNISITSANNLSAATFTVRGIGSPVDANGNPTQTIHEITEDIVGPNANTVPSLNVYSQIISITVDVNVNAVSVGFGDHGITDYVFLDSNRTFYSCAAQFQFITTAGAIATAYHSLSRPQYINSLQGNLINFQPLPAFDVSANMTNATNNQYSPVPMTRTVWSSISNTGTDSIYFTVVQQGIN